MSEPLSGANPRLQQYDSGHGRRHSEPRIFRARSDAPGLRDDAGNVFRQASMLAYIDNFWLLGVAIAAMIPLVFLMKRPPAGGAMAVH